MIRELPYRLSIILLASIFILSTSVPRINLHFCGGELASISFFQPNISATSCCNSEMTSDLQSIEKEACCNDEFVDLNWDVNLAFSGQTIEIYYFGGAPYPIDYYPPVFCRQQSIFPKNYIPPLITEDYQVQFEQYLI